MEKNLNSEQQLIQYNERIISLFRLLKKDFYDYSQEKLKMHDFTSPQVLIINELFKNPGLNLHDLSKQLDMAKSNASVMVERLVCKGIVVREIPKENRRTIKLTLSPEFEEKYKSLELRNKYWADIIKDASIEELDIVVNGLEKCHELMERNRLQNIDEIDEKSVQDFKKLD